jgi:hypothetical protein
LQVFVEHHRSKEKPVDQRRRDYRERDRNGVKKATGTPQLQPTPLFERVQRNGSHQKVLRIACPFSFSEIKPFLGTPKSSYCGKRQPHVSLQSGIPPTASTSQIVRVYFD